MTLLSPSECAAWYARTSGNHPVVLFDGSGGSRLDDVAGRTMQVDAVTALRWISAPKAGSTPRLLALSAQGATALVLHRDVDVLTGDIVVGPRSVDDPPVAQQLAALGLPAQPAPDADSAFALITQTAAASALVFAIVSEGEAPGAERERPPAPKPDELGLDIYNPRFIGLAGPFGAPLEAVWHIMWELSGVRWCLLNTDLDAEDVDRIPYRQGLSATDFVSALRACVDAGLHFLEIPVCVTTAPGHGHVIHIEAFEGDTVVYHDPWYGRSLLAAGNNAHGIAAQPWRGGARRWCVAVEDFKRVGYASLVQPAVWLRLCRVAVDVRFSNLASSDFYSFFRISEQGRSKDEASGFTHVRLQPGNWREHIAMDIVVDPKDEVRSALLTIRRAWLVAPATAPFGADLLTHFIGAMAAPADADEAQLLRRALRGLPSGRAKEILANGPPHLLAQFRLATLAVAGVVPFGRVTLPCSTLHFFDRTVEVDGKSQPWLVVRVVRPRDEAGPLPEDVESGYLMDTYRSFLWRYTLTEMARMKGVTLPDVGAVRR